MMGWIKRFYATDKPSQLDAELLLRLDKARQDHLDDLRTLLEESAKRQTELAGMVRMVMEERFYRPVITGGNADRNKVATLPPDSLMDVTVFDEEADGKMVVELEREFQDIVNEHYGGKSEANANA